MIQRLNPHEGYRRSAMLTAIFGQVISNELRAKALLFCSGDIETLIKTGIYREYLNYIPIDNVLLYFSLEDVSSFEKDVPEYVKQAALNKANELYRLYLEGMT